MANIGPARRIRTMTPTLALLGETHRLPRQNWSMAWASATARRRDRPCCRLSVRPWSSRRSGSVFSSSVDVRNYDGTRRGRTYPTFTISKSRCPLEHGELFLTVPQ